MSRRAAPKQFSAYVIRWSDEPSMPVDTVLIDKGALLERDWTVMNFETQKTTSAGGVRLCRLCPDCRVKFNSTGVLGHDGECGTDAVRAEALAEIRHAKKQVTP